MKKKVLIEKGILLKDFAEKEEEELLIQKANNRLAQMKEEGLISWDEATRLAGWE